MLVSAKEVVIPPLLNLTEDTCFTPENEVCDESQLPLRKLAVDSHLISLPRVDNCSIPRHTCLLSGSMGELTRTSMTWVGEEGSNCPSTFFVFVFFSFLFLAFLVEKCLFNDFSNTESGLSLTPGFS